MASPTCGITLYVRNKCYVYHYTEVQSIQRGNSHSLYLQNPPTRSLTAFSYLHLNPLLPPAPSHRSADSPCPHFLPDVVLWEWPSTWPISRGYSGAPPTPGSVVVLPANTRVMITGCSFTGTVVPAQSPSTTLQRGSNVFASIYVPSTSEVSEERRSERTGGRGGEGIQVLLREASH